MNILLLLVIHWFLVLNRLLIGLKNGEHGLKLHNVKFKLFKNILKPTMKWCPFWILSRENDDSRFGRSAIEGRHGPIEKSGGCSSTNIYPPTKTTDATMISYEPDLDQIGPKNHRVWYGLVILRQF